MSSLCRGFMSCMRMRSCSPLRFWTITSSEYWPSSSSYSEVAEEVFLASSSPLSSAFSFFSSPLTTVLSCNSSILAIISADY
ncbi:hypothetical protein FGO68_gene14845 [Halteria grandinella]|uniref:Uncharacterized protein n=1 Tax=Halteria grandinella TaxID=5974 RepID=A0A8J8NBE5_HALGN|nr:hypothetical protein FGO68_gene14845 [Halteria grandinella]